jgi:hypothetical protein
MQSTMNEPPVDPRAPLEDQEMVEALTKALDQMIADHVTGSPPGSPSRCSSMC